MSIHMMFIADDGQIAGVAFFLKPGIPNPTIQQIWDHMPTNKGNEQNIPGVEIDPAGLLPHDLAYYTYIGSVSAPPCNENVPWFILKTPVNISTDQIKAFAALYPHNIRPLQPLNGRAGKESQ